jgi:hypothetical protein
MAAQSKTQVCGHSPAEIMGLNPIWAWMSVCCDCYVLSGRGLCDRLITRPEESHQLWCIIVCTKKKMEEWQEREGVVVVLYSGI